MRGYVLRAGGDDYPDQKQGHWIDDHVATPTAKYSAYRDSRPIAAINPVRNTLICSAVDIGGPFAGI